MSLTPGTRLGPYEILGAIGAGGMGEVYRAKDTKLNRAVALKILPVTFLADPDRRARFTREAQVLASLNHPHIAGIYGFEESSDTHALAMEFVDGEDLSRIIARGAIPLPDALPIAQQIADALEAAHEQGIVHRDLKPANIRVRADGTVKVLDFGLAKAMESAGSATRSGGRTSTEHEGDGSRLREQDPSPSTMTSPAMTAMGMILGTAAYMAPEQAKGKAIDKRADIWAFGVVLYEMLSGRRAFKGDDVSETLASVLKDTPPMDALPPTTPVRLTRLIARCLDRDLKTRLRDIGEARIEIARIEAGETDPSMTSAIAIAPAPASARARALPWAVAAVLGVVALVLWAPWRTAPVPPETRTEISTPATDDPASFALSPDGRQVVFVASGDGASRLWLRSLSTTTAQPLSGTEGARRPFWSPDGRAIGFFAGASLMRLDLGAGAPHVLAPVTSGQGGTWNADGVILFAPTTTSPLMRVSAAGGDVTAATTLGPQQSAHNAPYFLPDGGRFLFFVVGLQDTAGIYLGALDGRAPTRLTAGNSSGVYLSDVLGSGGWLLWVRTGTLVSQRLDVEKAALTGEPLSLADGVVADSSYRSAVSATGAGLVAYRTGAGSERQLTWFDRSGAARGTVGDPDATLVSPRVSPDGRRVAVARIVQGNTDIWLLDGVRVSRLTLDAAVDRSPVWSPDGARIAFSSNRTDQFEIYQMLANGGVEEPLTAASDQVKTPYSWSADGRVLYSSVASQGNVDLLTVPTVGSHTPSVFLRTPFREAYGVFSPNGRWVAYQSNESGRPEVYVRPVVAPGAADAATGAGGQWPVSTSGGVFPAWRPDGNELYYLNPAGVMMAAPITVTGATLETGVPVVLFSTRIVGGGVDAQQGRQYDVAPDGRFLINTVLDTAAAPITLVQSWNPAVRK